MCLRAATLVFCAGLLGGAQTPERLFEQALGHYTQQRPGEAEGLLREALKQRPKWFQARFLLGAILVSLGRPAEAVQHLEAAHGLDPSHADCAKLLAAEYLGLNRPAESLRVLRRLLRTPDEESLLLAIEALHARNDAGDSGEAYQLGALGLKRYPDSARLLAWHGFALRERGEFDEARRSLEAALQLAPDDLGTRGILGDVLRREGRLEEALRVFDLVLTEDPADDEALIGKGRTLAAMGKTGEALRVMQAAIRAAPQAARLRLELSQLYARLGDSEGAAREAAEFRRLREAHGENRLPHGLRSVTGTQR